jgi:glycosyltransferase involved in cell wall biosynthesis
MNIVQINETTRQGGAALSMMRLHEGLLAAGHDSRVLAGWATDRDERVAVVGPLSIVDRLFYHGFNLLGLNYLGIPNARRVLEHPFVREADVVHLHNVHGGYISYRILPALSRLKPVVWTLHDMWALTGHCASSLDCARWRTGCGRCPHPELYPPIRLDATALEWRLKRRLYRKSGLTVLCPSLWLTRLAREGMPQEVRVRHVPHGIDTAQFRPLDRAACRAALDLPAAKRILLLVAQNTRNPYKNATLLWDAVRGLTAGTRAQTLLLVLGAGGVGGADVGGAAVRELGYVDSETVKAQAYAAADVFAHPTRADNQPLVLQEAAACGCPMVSVDVGGVGEIVRHGETGLLAAPGDAAGFRANLERLLTDPVLRAQLGRNARAMAEREYAMSCWIHTMTALYSDAVSRAGLCDPLRRRGAPSQTGAGWGNANKDRTGHAS